MESGATIYVRFRVFELEINGFSSRWSSFVKSDAVASLLNHVTLLTLNDDLIKLSFLSKLSQVTQQATLWQYGLSSFQGRDTKIDRYLEFLPKIDIVGTKGQITP